MYRYSLSFCIVIAILFNIAIAAVDQGPSTYYSEADKAQTQKNLLSFQKSDGTFLGLRNTYYAVNALEQLKQEVPKKQEICDFAKSATVVTTEDAFYQLSLLEALKCTTTPSEKAKGLIKSGLKSAALGDLYHSVVVAIPQHRKIDITEKEIKDAVDRILELQDDDGAFKRTSDDSASVLYTGLALDALARIAKLSAPTKDEKEKLETALKNAGNVFSLGETEDNAFVFSDEESKASTLRVTATLFSGITALALQLGKPVQEVKEDIVVGITETLLKSKNSAVPEDTFFFLEGINAVGVNPFSKPVCVTLPSKSLVGGKDVKVKVSDVFGNAVKSKVLLVKAYPSQQESTPIATNQELTAAEPTLYQFNLMASKPEPGFYTLVLTVTPEDKKFIAVNKEHVNVKVAGAASVSDFVLTVSDSKDELTEGKKYKPEHGKAVSEVIKVGAHQHLYFEFKVKGQTGKSLQVQQTFVRITDKSGREAMFVAEGGAKGYAAHVDIKTLGKMFYNQNGTFTVELLVGDAFLQNPSQWNIGSLQVTFPSDAHAVPQSPFSALPEIKHIFRVPEKRPLKIISLAFTGAVLGIPALILFIGLLRVGAGISLPGGSGFIWAVGFQATLGAILALFGLYWLRLNMVQTLGYLGVLAIPFLFFAQKNFNTLAQKQHIE